MHRPLKLTLCNCNRPKGVISDCCIRFFRSEKINLYNNVKTLTSPVPTTERATHNLTVSANCYGWCQRGDVENEFVICRPIVTIRHYVRYTVSKIWRETGEKLHISQHVT